jgi:tRNA pseudouridine38-40 synthase
MAAALLLVGNGEADTDSIPRLLHAAGESSLQPAPAEGLILHDTDCGIAWVPLLPNERSAGFVRDLCRHHALMEHVCRAVKPE